MYPRLASMDTRVLPGSQMLGDKDADTVLGKIKRSMENVKTLDKIGKGVSERDHGKESPFDGSTNHLNPENTSRKNRRYSSSDVQLKSWSEAINGISEFGVPSSLEQGKASGSGKNRRRMSSEGFSRQVEGEISDEGPGSVMLDVEKRKKIEMLLKRQTTLPRTSTVEEEGISQLVRKNVTGSEEVTPMMIKEWRQRDLERLKTYLSDNLMKGADKKTGQYSKKITGGRVDEEIDDDKKNSNKNKRKKTRNPNVGTSSGSVTTSIKAKLAIATTENFDETTKQGLKSSVLIKEEEEEEEEISPFDMPNETESSERITDEALNTIANINLKGKNTGDSKPVVNHTFFKTEPIHYN